MTPPPPAPPPLIPPSVSYVARPRTPDSGGHGPFNLLQWPYRMIFLLLSDMKQSYVMEYENVTVASSISRQFLIWRPRILPPGNSGHGLAVKV